MKNFKKLSRKEMKNVQGGQSCTLTIKQSDGTYKTYSGTCKTKSLVMDFANGVSQTFESSYCEAGFGQVSLSSNGGVSRCG